MDDLLGTPINPIPTARLATMRGAEGFCDARYRIIPVTYNISAGMEFPSTNPTMAGTALTSTSVHFLGSRHRLGENQCASHLAPSMATVPNYH